MRKILSVIILSLFVSIGGSCGPKHRSNNGSIAYVGSRLNMPLHVPPGTSTQEVELLLESLNLQLTQFELDWRSRSFGVETHLFDSETIPCGDLHGDFIGCHYSGINVIHVVFGRYYETPAFYHELVHHNIPGNDHNHSDHRWSTIWTPTQLRLNNQISATRRSRLIFNIHGS